MTGALDWLTDWFVEITNSMLAQCYEQFVLDNSAVIMIIASPGTGEVSDWLNEWWNSKPILAPFYGQFVLNSVCLFLWLLLLQWCSIRLIDWFVEINRVKQIPVQLCFIDSLSLIVLSVIMIIASAVVQHQMDRLIDGNHLNKTNIYLPLRSDSDPGTRTQDFP